MSMARLIPLLFGVVGARFVAAGLGLVTQIVLARTLSTGEVGGYLLAVSLAGFLGLVISAGYPAMALTALARFHALGRERLVRGFLTAARRDLAVLTAVLAVSTAAALALLDLPEAKRLALLCGSASAPVLAVIRLNGALANSRRRFALSFAIDFVLRAVALLAVILAWLLWVGTLTLGTVLAAFFLTALGAAVLQAALLARGASPQPPPVATRPGRLHIWRARCLAMLIVSIFTMAFADLVTLVAGWRLPATEVAVIGIAVRLAVLVGFITQASQQFAIRDLTTALVAGRREDERALLRHANLLTLGFMAAAIVAASLGGDALLAVFGPHYRAGRWLLVVLLVGQAVRASGGMNIYLLALDGGQFHAAVLCVAALLILAAAAFALTPLLGAMGVAVAAVFADLVWAGGVAWVVHRKLGRRGDILAVAAPAR